MKDVNLESMTIEEYKAYREKNEKQCTICGLWFLTHSRQRQWCYECSAEQYKAKKREART